MEALERLYQRYRRQVDFFVIYIREAHTLSPGESAQQEGEFRIRAPSSLLERQQVAQTCLRRLNLTLPALMDGMGNELERAYAAHPSRYYVVGVGGQVVYQSAPGPWGLRPWELEQALQRLVGE